MKDPSVHGDMYAAVQIQVPQSESRKQSRNSVSLRKLLRHKMLEVIDNK